jgi:hypothetical protein
MRSHHLDEYTSCSGHGARFTIMNWKRRSGNRIQDFELNPPDHNILIPSTLFTTATVTTEGDTGP